MLRKLFAEVTTTSEVQREFGKEFLEWIHIEVVSDENQQTLLETEVDKGEASAIALAIEKGSSLLILDHFKARKLAAKLHLRFTGTLGILLKAKQAGIIQTIQPVLEKIQQTDFRFSEKIFMEILRNAEEA